MLQIKQPNQINLLLIIILIGLAACAPKARDLNRPELRSALTSASCNPNSTRRPPFYGSSVTGITKENFDFSETLLQSVYSENSAHITTENFRDFQKQIRQRISRNTLIRPLTEQFQRFEITESKLQSLFNEKPEGFLLPVEVINPEKIYSRMKSSSDKKLFVNEGDQGLIYSESVFPLTAEQVLIAEKDFNSSSNTLIKKGSVLELGIANNQEYLGNICVTEKGEEQTYSFHLKEKTADKTIELHPALDGWNLYPVAKKHLPSLESVKTMVNSLYQQAITLADLEIDYKGFVRLPMTNEQRSSQISGTAYDSSFVHYHGGDPDRSDTWGKANTICAVSKLASAWAKECKQSNCTLQYGDIAFPTDAKSLRAQEVGQVRDPLFHQTHHRGECIDIRPFRKDGLLTGTNYKSSAYDGKLAKDFLKFAANFGAGLIYFNDTEAISGVKNAQTSEGHDDHFHICFYNEDRGGQDFCRN